MESSSQLMKRLWLSFGACSKEILDRLSNCQLLVLLYIQNAINSFPSPFTCFDYGSNQQLNDGTRPMSQNICCEVHWSNRHLLSRCALFFRCARRLKPSGRRDLIFACQFYTCWGFRFSRRRLWLWLSYGMLHRVVSRRRPTFHRYLLPLSSGRSSKEITSVCIG
jgi:hypothetical protein